MSSNRKIPKKLEEKLLKVLHEEEQKGEKEGLLSKNQPNENSLSASRENRFEAKANEMLQKYNNQRQALTTRGDGGESSDVNLKGLLHPSTIRGNDSESQMVPDSYVKYDDNASLLLEDYKYPDKSRPDSSSFDQDEDNISYAEHLSYSVHRG